MLFLFHIKGDYMKKILIVCLACFIANSAVEAKDYVKHQINEMKKSQQYSATNKYFADYAPQKTITNVDYFHHRTGRVLYTHGFL